MLSYSTSNTKTAARAITTLQKDCCQIFLDFVRQYMNILQENTNNLTLLHQSITFIALLPLFQKASLTAL